MHIKLKHSDVDASIHEAKCLPKGAFFFTARCSLPQPGAPRLCWVERSLESPNHASLVTYTHSHIAHHGVQAPAPVVQCSPLATPPGLTSLQNCFTAESALCESNIPSCFLSYSSPELEKPSTSLPMLPHESSSLHLPQNLWRAQGRRLPLA